jgi:hypothetical protein
MPSNKPAALAPQWPHDRADVCAMAILMIVQTLSDPGGRRAAISEYLRDEIRDIERQAVHDNSVN